MSGANRPAGVFPAEGCSSQLGPEAGKEPQVEQIFSLFFIFLLARSVCFFACLPDVDCLSGSGRTIFMGVSSEDSRGAGAAGIDTEGDCATEADCCFVESEHRGVAFDVADTDVS